MRPLRHPLLVTFATFIAVPVGVAAGIIELLRRRFHKP